MSLRKVHSNLLSPEKELLLIAKAKVAGRRAKDQSQILRDAAKLIHAESVKLKKQANNQPK